MNKTIFFILLILLYVMNSFSQTNPNFYQKYSYLLFQSNEFKTYDEFVVNPEPIIIGTGFLIAKKNRLFLITSSHIVNGIDAFNGLIMPTHPNLSLRYFDSEKHRYEFFHIEIDPKLKEQKIYSFLDYPDAIAIEIKNLPKNFFIFSIEEHIEANKNNDNVSSAFYWGYGEPNKDYAVQPPFDIRNQRPNILRGEILDASKYDPKKNPEKVGLLHYVITPHGSRGSSGSPVFFVKSVKKDDKFIDYVEFAGVQVGCSDTYNCTYIVKASVIEKLIEAVK